jgi:tRNA-dihydrouridine synthase
MDEVDLLVDIVSTLSKGLSIPVTCKVRIFKDYEKTIHLCESLVNAGASLLTVHGRTREEKGQLVGEVDWQTIARIKKHFANRPVPIPIIANGGIECLADVDRCIAATGADGVMSSEGILENPALYTASVDKNGTHRTQLELTGNYYTALGVTMCKPTCRQLCRLPFSLSVRASFSSLVALPGPASQLCSRVSTEEYLSYCAQYPVHHMKIVRSHVMKMLHRYTTLHVELRDLIGTTYTLEGYMQVSY